LLVLRAFEVEVLPVDACAKRCGDLIVVVFRTGLSVVDRRTLIRELLTPLEVEETRIP
jgi:hypothetical protein